MRDFIAKGFADTIFDLLFGSGRHARLKVAVVGMILVFIMTKALDLLSTSRRPPGPGTQ